jgi:hypothetical protein
VGESTDRIWVLFDLLDVSHPLVSHIVGCCHSPVPLAKGLPIDSFLCAICSLLVCQYQVLQLLLQGLWNLWQLPIVSSPQLFLYLFDLLVNVGEAYLFAPTLG